MIAMATHLLIHSTLFLALVNGGILDKQGGADQNVAKFFQDKPAFEKYFKFLQSKGLAPLLHDEFFINQKREQASGIDPDANRNLTELIIAQGYPVEKYTVQTEDGYLLDLHRIPSGLSRRQDNGQPKKAVLLQHGLLSSACDWVMNFEKDSLGFILADAGYDVWMGNSRGNTYSLKHVKYTPNDVQFWDFSFDEMAKYDLTAFINFVLNKTSQSSLFYIAHSQGTSMAYALFSSQPEYQKKVKLFVNLAPVTRIAHSKSFVKYFSLMTDQLLFDIFGRKDFLPSSTDIRYLVDALCQDVATRWICYNVMFLLTGPDISNLNQTRLVVYMNHSPAGASVKDLIHYAQVYRKDLFGMYDYGSEEENMKHYNKTVPPIYDVTNVQVPVVAFTGTNDWLADPQDVAVLLKKIPNVQYHEMIPGYNHLDFLWAENAAKLTYGTLLEWLHKYSSQ